MSNTATLSQNPETLKWEAKFQGQVLAASLTKSYVIENITSGRCNKANKAKVVNVVEADGSPAALTAVSAAIPQAPKMDRFTINERFDFLEGFVTGVAKRKYPSLIVTGEGGLGKTWTVNKALKAAGLTNASEITGSQKVLKPGVNEDEAEESDYEVIETIGVGTDSGMSEKESRKYYTVVKGFSTAKGLYALLWENRNRIIVFDDCDSILKDPVALNILKGALDSYDRRMISWNARGFVDDGLPTTFEFKGGVIFISNMPLWKIDQAVRNRAIPVDLSMNIDQKLERMITIVESGEFLPNYEMKFKKMGMEFLDSMKNEPGIEVSFRTLIVVTKFAEEGNIGKTKWERRAEYFLLNAA